MKERLARGAQLTATTLAAVLLAACGSSGHHAAGSAPAGDSSTSSAAPLSPTQILTRSRAVLDATPAVHFELASAHIAPNVTALVSGHGDLVRPAGLHGSLLVTESGVSATLGVIAVGGKLYVELPFASSYRVVNPASYGLGNPANLLSKTHGVSSLLTDLRSPRSDGSIRLDGELLDVISGTVPGREVPVLPDLDRAKAVAVTVDIAPSSYQLRRVQLAGPFTKASTTTTYDVTITDYGEHVTVVVPKT